MMDHGRQRKTILLLEDDPEFADVASAALTAAGFGVLAVPHAEDALRILDSPQPLDLLLTDIRLPPGMPHGFALARLARNRRLHLKILYVTAYRDLAALEADQALGKILYKPIHPDILVAEVAQALARD
jgi:CheY-like chemotaxis protein